MSHSVTCPLCNGEMHLIELKAAPNGRQDKSYIWVCELCPGILLEWWDDKDTQAFTDYINHGKGIIKDWSGNNEPTV